MNNPETTPVIESTLEDALAFADELCGDVTLSSGEPMMAHARGMLSILDTLRVDDLTRKAAALFGVAERVTDAQETLTQRFGAEIATLVVNVRKLQLLGGVSTRVTANARSVGRDPQAARKAQVEALRKMLLAFAQDIRGVLIRLASRVQTLRWYAGQKLAPPPELAHEVLEIYAPLANRLGIWQLKWELEDLAFRFEHPDTYKRIARLLDEKRVEREQFIRQAIERLQHELTTAGVKAEVSGRPKHIYSIWRKMRGKELDFAELYDVRAFRVIVDDVKDCYTVLGIVHNLWQPIPKEFDDYISRPKPNGYKSLHTVVIDEQGRAFEVQIRTHEMHHFAEYGVAAHWRYKEAGQRGYAGQVVANESYDEKIAWLRQLLAWKDDVADRVEQDDVAPWEQLKHANIDDHIYVMTPQARVIALPQGATPVDFAYYLHTELGHRCRGARVDGAMVPLNTPLRNGQTVEIVAVKQGGPSRDWLNSQLGYLHSQRARNKVRAWFNAVELQETIAHGRAIIDKTLQREGKTSTNLDELATRLGFKNADEFYAAVAKEEFSLRHVESALSGAPSPEARSDDALVAKKSLESSVAQGASSGVLVLGVGALLTQLAKCCKPAPPDEIVGFVTHGKGISVHRCDCRNFAAMRRRAPERVLQAAWSSEVLEGRGEAAYPVDIQIEATDRQGLLRDISEIFSREKINVTGVNTQSRTAHAYMQFTVEVRDAGQLQRALAQLGGVVGVRDAKRK
ncbi:GTP pyrophosphokinase [Pandoraea thiooxydans]|uniref:GTP pyrophosphokinase n=1 Tax=Pandoraea thiooxydans TaxID=445709 RepID=A0A0G3ENL0_9BURK|nr:bifunctional (p)ppGpp synthetase/guanosine-3',5'-bis(diphosphate) 3'-pyrophosphohydrolase [Pandoraea thiooxydans]AKJ68560.1 GTP pyrophosphokinase [Pandoraea thiooxydans]